MRTVQNELFVLHCKPKYNVQMQAKFKGLSNTRGKINNFFYYISI